MLNDEDLQKAALRGVPSHAWRAGQERRLKMILEAGEGREQGTILVDGCGVGAYLGKLALQPDRQLAWMWSWNAR